MQNENKKLKPSKQNKTLIGNKPIFYLVYMIFYFAPWVFQSPKWIDVAVAIAVIALFVPVHFWSFHTSDRYRLVAIFFLELLALASAPFHLSFGVFHIYAAAQAGLQSTLKKSVIALILGSTMFFACGYFFDRSWAEMGFIMMMSMLVWVTSMTEFEKNRRQSVLIRERELDKQQASLMERERIAGDLHDLLGHTLTMVALKSEIASKLLEVDPARAKQEILEINRESRSALKDVRAAVSGITSTTLLKEIENAEVALSAANVSFTVIGDVPSLTIEKDKAASLAIREAVTNVVRHSDATSVELTFGQDNTSHILTFKDNGSNAGDAEGSGLSGLKRRIENIGGEAVINMLDGVKIEAKLPLN